MNLNHAVLKVRDLDRSVAFYHDVLGFQEIGRMGARMAFMRAPDSNNHHDLGFLALGPRAGEVMWLVPRELWGEYESKAVTQPLDLDAEIARFGKRSPANHA